MPTPDFRLARNAYGRLIFTAADGAVGEEVVPVRAFPLSAPADGVALVALDGREVAWIECLDALAADLRALVEEELGSRSFMPEILEIRSVSSFATPSTWQVRTDRGDTALVLKSEDDIRHMGATGLLIADAHGVDFHIHDMLALDRGSRRLLDRFL